MSAESRSTRQSLCLIPRFAFYAPATGQIFLQVGQRALKASGIEHCRIYDCRHTFATRAVEAGVDLVTLAALLGHSKIQMVLRYAHPTKEHQAQAIKKLEEFAIQRQMAEMSASEMIQ